MLCGSHFVVLCLRSYTQLPQFNVQVFHERTDSLTDSAEVMIFQLLSLGCGCTEQGTSGEDQIFTLQVFISVYQEIFLLGPTLATTFVAPVLPNSLTIRSAWVLTASMERSNGVFLSSASPL